MGQGIFYCVLIVYHNGGSEMRVTGRWGSRSALVEYAILRDAFLLSRPPTQFHPSADLPPQFLLRFPSSLAQSARS